MRSGTKIGKLALTVEADLLALGQVVYKLDLVRLVFLLKIFDRFVSVHIKALDRKIFLYYLLHLGFNASQSLVRKCHIGIEVIIETVFYRRTDSQPDIRIKALYRLRHYVRRGVPERAATVVVVKCEYRDIAVLFNDRAKIGVLAVYFGCTCRLCQTGTYRLRDTYSGDLAVIFLTVPPFSVTFIIKICSIPPSLFVFGTFA